MRRLGAARARATPPAPPEGGPSPVFWSLDGTTADLVDHLAAALTARGVSSRTGTRVQAVERQAGGRHGASGWTLILGTTGSEPAPAGTLAGRRPGPGGPGSGHRGAARPPRPGGGRRPEHHRVRLGGGGHPGLPVGIGGGPLRGTGFLVPRTSTVAGRPALITGCTFLSRKWPHLARPGDELIRASVGRFGDDRAGGLDDDRAHPDGPERAAPDPGRPGRPARDAGDPLGPGVPPVRGGPPDPGGPGSRRTWPACRGWRWPVPRCGAWASRPCIGSGRSAARQVRSSLAGPPGPGRGRAGRARAGVVTTPVPTDDRPDTPRWRPSRIAMTERRRTAVRPRRGGVALPAVAVGRGPRAQPPSLGLVGTGLSGRRPALVASGGPAAADPPVGGVVGRCGPLRSRTDVGQVLHRPRGPGPDGTGSGVHRGGLPGRPPRTGGGPDAHLPGRPHLGRGGEDAMAVRGPAHRRGLPGPGRRSGPRGGPAGRTPRADPGRVPRRGRPGRSDRSGGPDRAGRGPGPGLLPGGPRRCRPTGSGRGRGRWPASAPW